MFITRRDRCVPRGRGVAHVPFVPGRNVLVPRDSAHPIPWRQAPADAEVRDARRANGPVLEDARNDRREGSTTPGDWASRVRRAGTSERGRNACGERVRGARHDGRRANRRRVQPSGASRRGPQRQPIVLPAYPDASERHQPRMRSLASGPGRPRSSATAVSQGERRGVKHPDTTGPEDSLASGMARAPTQK